MGYAFAANCSTLKTPGYIITNATAPGCYVMCGGVTNLYKKRIFYLLDHPKLAWVKTNITEIRKVNGTLKVSDEALSLMFGRVKYKGFQTLGKVHQKPKLTFVIKTSATTKMEVNTDFEVLSCLP